MLAHVAARIFGAERATVFPNIVEYALKKMIPVRTFDWQGAIGRRD
jgi:hypothetical protein